MIDYGCRKTNLALKRTEARLRAVYRQAEKDITAKLEAFEKRHAERDKLYREKVAAGEIDKADYDAWLRGQVFQGDQWRARRSSIQNVLYDADNAAVQIINNRKVEAFTANANYMGYTLEHGEGVNFGFTLYDENTVARLLRDNPQMLPKAKVKKDKAYTWYNQLVNNCVTQGIIQGEGIAAIARRIGETTGERTKSAMLRNARTAFTGAQNAGRIEALHQAKELGIDVKKRWMATFDARTRDAHADLDGQIQEVDDPFESALGKIMYPGDPKARPGNVYNCRCTLVYDYPEYPSEMKRRDNISGEILAYMTYREWEESKKQFTPRKNNVIINTSEDDTVTGSLQSRRKHEKMDALKDATPTPDETAEIVKTFKRIEGQHTRKDDMDNVNPHYLDGREWQVNCQRCCPTFEARRRGFDVTAKPLYGLPFNDDYARGPMGYTKFFDRGNRIPENIYRKLGLDRDALTLEQIKDGIGKIMDDYGNGSRAIINGYWETGGDGHVFMAENVGGKVQFYDPQSGTMDYTRPFEAMEARSMMIFRIDDLPFTEDIGNAVSNNDRY